MRNLCVFYFLLHSNWFSIDATVKWISQPRSRLFVNAGETAEINWRFPSGAKLITYKKIDSIFGNEVTIASKYGNAKAQMFNATESILVLDDSGTLRILKSRVKDEGIYKIAVTYAKGITLNSRVEIKIQELPVITTFPTYSKNEVFYTGMTLNLLCIAKGRPIPVVTWFKDDLKLEKSFGSILYQIESASIEDSGRYVCLAENRGGKSSRSIQYVILRKPYDVEFFHNMALDSTIFEGESVMFTCSAKGNPPISYYKFLHNGSEVHRSALGKYIIEKVLLKNDGIISCVPVNKAGLGETKAIVLRVKERSQKYWQNSQDRKSTEVSTKETEQESLKRRTNSSRHKENSATLITTTTITSLGRNSAWQHTHLSISLCFLSITATSIW